MAEKYFEHEVKGQGIPLDTFLDAKFGTELAGDGEAVTGDGTNWESVDSGTKNSADSGMCVRGNGETGEGSGTDSPKAYAKGLGEEHTGFSNKQHVATDENEED